MRKSTFTIALLSGAIVLSSCGNGNTGDSPPLANGEAVELEGDLPFSVQSFGQFAEPWAIAVEPATGNVFITEKEGTAQLFARASGASLPVSGLPDVAYGGQGGLGDVEFAPDYADSGMVYISWAKADEGDARRAAVGRGEMSCDDTQCEISNFTQIWQQEPAIESFGHFSHRIAFSPDGEHLFISSGDRMQQDPAQDNSNTLGTVVRLNLDGSPAAGNPWADQPSPANQIWSYGHRNMLGLAFDTGGQLWDLEHGPRGGDELNMVQEGHNYGWPVRSDGDNYSGVEIPNHSDDDGFTKPAISWNPVIAPGGMLFYHGELFADWTGDALVANLGTTSLVRLDTNAQAGTASEAERLTFPNRLRDIAEAADGALWIIEDGPRGRLLHLTPAQ